MRKNRQVKWYAAAGAAVLIVSSGVASAAPAAVSGQTLKAREVVTRESPYDNLSKYVIAPCPAGKVAIGGGAILIGGLNDLFLTANDLDYTGTDWLAMAVAGPNHKEPWKLKVTVICAREE